MQGYNVLLIYNSTREKFLCANVVESHSKDY